MSSRSGHLQLDARAVRVLAHPLRARLLSELRLNGNATATALAGRLATNTGATSYHLRKLAEVGLVVETEEGHGRQRVWAAAQETHGWRDADVQADPDALAAAGWLREHYWAYHGEKAARWEDARAAWPVAWRDAASMSDAILELSADRLRALTDELDAVIRRHRDAAAAEPDQDARRVTILYYAMPADPGDPP